MAIDGKYGHVSTERGTIGDSEPVVVFRATDAFLPQLLADYYRICDDAGCGKHHLAVIAQRRKEIAAWQRLNQGQVKIPDTTADQAPLDPGA